jgi:hypothetical protein
LLQKKPDINNELVTPKEHKIGDWVGKGSDHDEPPVLVLTREG